VQGRNAIQCGRDLFSGRRTGWRVGGGGKHQKTSGRADSE
jgi:hypothetical protein